MFAERKKKKNRKRQVGVGSPSIGAAGEAHPEKIRVHGMQFDTSIDNSRDEVSLNRR